MKRKIYSTIIPSVRDCKHGNCSTYFPQFSKLTARELRRSLRRALRVPQNDYFHTAYKNSEELVKEYEKILKLPFLKACETLYQLQKAQTSYVRYDMYMSLHGEVLVHRQCCN